MITNKELDEKLDKIYSKIDQLFGLSNKNQIAVTEVRCKVGELVEHVKLQNGRIGKCESNIEGIDGVCKDHECILTDLTNKIENFFSRHNDIEKARAAKEEKTEDRKFTWRKLIADHASSIVTGVVVGIILLLARLLWGI